MIAVSSFPEFFLRRTSVKEHSNIGNCDVLPEKGVMEEVSIEEPTPVLAVTNKLPVIRSRHLRHSVSNFFGHNYAVAVGVHANCTFPSTPEFRHHLR